MQDGSHAQVQIRYVQRSGLLTATYDLVRNTPWRCYPRRTCRWPISTFHGKPTSKTTFAIISSSRGYLVVAYEDDCHKILCHTIRYCCDIPPETQPSSITMALYHNKTPNCIHAAFIKSFLLHTIARLYL